jgi:hypothetical protein
MLVGCVDCLVLRVIDTHVCWGLILVLNSGVRYVIIRTYQNTIRKLLFFVRHQHCCCLKSFKITP